VVSGKSVKKIAEKGKKWYGKEEGEGKNQKKQWRKQWREGKTGNISGKENKWQGKRGKSKEK
jgi:hypothetical protein